MSSKYLKPCMIKIVGREAKELARLSFPGSGRFLPEAGDWRPWIGPEGNWWRRRVSEGCAVEATEPRPKPKKRDNDKD